MITLTNFLFVHGSFTLIKCSFHPCNWCIPSAHFPRNLSLMHRKCEWKFRLRSRARCKPRCVYRRGAMTAIHQLPEKKKFVPSIYPRVESVPSIRLIRFLFSKNIYSQSSRNNGSLKLLSRLNTQSAIILHYNFKIEHWRNRNHWMKSIIRVWHARWSMKLCVEITGDRSIFIKDTQSSLQMFLFYWKRKAIKQ